MSRDKYDNTRYNIASPQTSCGVFVRHAFISHLRNEQKQTTQDVCGEAKYNNIIVMFQAGITSTDFYKILCCHWLKRNNMKFKN